MGHLRRIVQSERTTNTEAVSNCRSSGFSSKRPSMLASTLLVEDSVAINVCVQGFVDVEKVGLTMKVVAAGS
jgi:hypothetical protein